MIIYNVVRKYVGNDGEIGIAIENFDSKEKGIKRLKEWYECDCEYENEYEKILENEYDEEKNEYYVEIENNDRFYDYGCLIEGYIEEVELK